MLSLHFSEKECKCPCCERMIVNPIQIRLLESIRAAVKLKIGETPLTVHSWNRCEKHNKAIDGEEKSQHLFGTATDISAKGLKPKELGKIALQCGADGVGVYATFVHVDCRGYAARWEG